MTRTETDGEAELLRLYRATDERGRAEILAHARTQVELAEKETERRRAALRVV